MAGILSTGIIVLENYVVDLLIGVARIGKYNRLTKYINKVSLRQITISIGYR